MKKAVIMKETDLNPIFTQEDLARAIRAEGIANVEGVTACSRDGKLVVIVIGDDGKIE